MRPALYTIGALCELLGIVLIAAPDLVPGAKRLSRWIRLRWRTIENRAKRLLRLSPRGQVVQVAGIGSAMALGGGVRAFVSPRKDASLEEKVAYLVRRDREAQEAEGRIKERVDALEAESRQRVEDLRLEIEALIESELRAAQEDFRAVRIGGAVALTIGLMLTTLGNFA